MSAKRRHHGRLRTTSGERTPRPLKPVAKAYGRRARYGLTKYEQRRIERACEHVFQWHMQSEDFGICSLCGHEATDEEIAQAAA